jgi:major type 1 subunit fimbrin (pilin)
MNKTLLSAALIAGFGVAAFAPQAAQAVGANSGGTITITGAIAASTCNMLVNGVASPTVVLPTTMTNALAIAGSTSGWTSVSMVLSACTTIAPYTTVTPFFSGANIDAGTGYLKNTGSALNVEVALSPNQSLTNVLTLAGTVGNQGVASTSLSAAGGATYQLYAGYVAQAGGAGAGSVSTSVVYALNYQ